MKKSVSILALIILNIFGFYFGLVWTGRQPIPGFVIEWMLENRGQEGLPLAMSDSLFLDEFTSVVALDMLQAMSEMDECQYDKYIFNDIGTAHKVYLALGYEFLNGRSSKILCWHMDGGYILGWERGNEVISQHQAASEYINLIWSQIEGTVNGLGSEKEKADFIADYIMNNIVREYDYSLANGTIYDLYISGTGTGVCNVFATLFDRLCEKAGIESYVIIGRVQGVLHTWNKVIFTDGSVHHYDLTFCITTKDMGYKDMSEYYYGLGEYVPVVFNSAEGYNFGCYKLQ